MLSKVWVVLLLWFTSSLFGNRISKRYIFLFKYLFDMYFSSMEPGEDPSSSMVPMVSIAAVGGEAPIWTTYERLAVETCLQKLKDNGYFVPDFSYFGIKQLQVRGSNVILTTERLCQLTRQDRV
jgi:hypothetical protein